MGMRLTVNLVPSFILACSLAGCGDGGSETAGFGDVCPETTPDTSLGPDADARIASARAGIGFLAYMMDLYHARFPVYDDVSSGGNHFHTFGFIPDSSAAVEVNGSWSKNPNSGATAIRFEFHDVPGRANFGGIYFLNGILPAGAMAPVVNFGEVPNSGIDLTGASKLVFHARGESGGERIQFFMAGVGRNHLTGDAITPFPGSSPRHPKEGTITILTTEWQRYDINVSALDLSYVLGGFAWVATDAHNPGGAVFYIDDISYELGEEAQHKRLNEPRWIQSFETHPVQPDVTDDDLKDDFDFVLRNTAFTYDNALALLAFLADDCDDSLRRAHLIGRAMVYAAQNDRFFGDGKLRTAYASGDLALPPGWTPNDLVGTTVTPGFFDESRQRFFEVHQDSMDVGNNAWSLIALLALHKATDNTQYFRTDYLTTAGRIAGFILDFRNSDPDSKYHGYQGGIDNPEQDSATCRAWASSEHNLDAYAAFLVMAEITGEAQWIDRAEHARAFVESMWDAELGCYLAGTTDSFNRNHNELQLPLDVQSWSALALPDALTRHPSLFECVEEFHRTAHAGYSGYDFNDDQLDDDGVWFEGTAQMALAYAITGNNTRALELRTTLRRAQASDRHGGRGGIVAATFDGHTTGFGFEYFRRLHIGATAWHVFAQFGSNPYYLFPMPS